MEPREFAKRWTFSPLQSWSLAALQAADLSPAASAFLQLAGLPTTTLIHGWVFGGEFLSLPLVADLLKVAGRPCPPSCMRSRVIGADMWPYRQVASWIVVEPAPRSSVSVVSAVGAPTWAFVNTSVPQLAECLLVSHLLLEKAKGEGDDVFAELLRRSVSIIDDEALTDPESFWSVTVEEAAYGM